MFKEIAPQVVQRFLSDDEDSLIYIIQATDDRFIVVHDDCYFISSGETFVGTKEEIEQQYNIKL